MKRIYHSQYKEGTVKSEDGSNYVVIFDSVGEITVPKSTCSEIIYGI